MKNIDVLYIKGKVSENNDEEMKYSLRSLERFCIEYGRIFITGECPEYINRETVVFTPEKDIGNPMINHWWKVSQTIKKTDISEYFVLMYDDIFFTQVTNIEKIQRYWRGILGEDKRGSEDYRECLEDTKKWLRKNGITYFDYELHTPFIYGRKEFKKLDIIFDKIKDSRLGMAPRSIYGNIISEGMDEFRRDIKIRTEFEKPEDITIKYDCFSVSESAWKYQTKRWCQEHFKQKSRWEK